MVPKTSKQVQREREGGLQHGPDQAGQGQRDVLQSRYREKEGCSIDQIKLERDNEKCFKAGTQKEKERSASKKVGQSAIAERE